MSGPSVAIAGKVPSHRAKVEKADITGGALQTRAAGCGCVKNSGEPPIA
jgi:hypothetical protein